MFKVPLMTPIRTILHPTDFSAHSERAWELACALAKTHGARLVVLHVLEQPLTIHAGVMMSEPPPLPLAEELKSLQERLQLIQAPNGTTEVQHQLLVGDTVTAILQIAREQHCDLIVLGTHGRTGLSRVLLGSVAEKVLRKADCPVLVVKSPLSETGKP
jgi:nucleotide-binding universal stress UspA family protein